MKKFFWMSAATLAAYYLGKLLADILSEDNLGEVEVEYGDKTHKYRY